MIVARCVDHETRVRTRLESCVRWASAQGPALFPIPRNAKKKNLIPNPWQAPTARSRSSTATSSMRAKVQTLQKQGASEDGAAVSPPLGSPSGRYSERYRRPTVAPSIAQVVCVLAGCCSCACSFVCWRGAVGTSGAGCVVYGGQDAMAGVCVSVSARAWCYGWCLCVCECARVVVWRADYSGSAAIFCSISASEQSPVVVISRGRERTTRRDSEGQGVCRCCTRAAT